MKVENWNGYDIRFVEKDSEWWAVAADVCTALDIKNVSLAVNGNNTRRKQKNGSKGLNESQKGICEVNTPGGKQDMLVISESGIFKLVFKSHKKEAEEFQDWVYEILKELRRSAGLEGFQIFRMLDKEHQREAMSKLCYTLKKPVRVDFIKANVIANKAVSTKYGHPKMVKKADMTPEMLADRQELLDDTVDLMAVKEKFNLNISVSDEVYKMVDNSNRQVG